VVTAVAFCPSPPLLVPELAAGAASELDPLRAACREAVRRLLAADPAEIVVIAPASANGRFPAGTGGTLAGYGVPLVATLPGAPAGDVLLPPALTLGAWLLADVGVPCSGIAVAADTDPAAVAVELAGRALLVMGDGSARRSDRAPGYVDPRAEPFDAAVAAALAAGDAAALRDLDPAVGADLLAAGVPAWRAVGYAAGARAGGFDAELLHDAAPYGVGYLVASWTAR
jgi:hypothetical protein